VIDRLAVGKRKRLEEIYRNVHRDSRSRAEPRYGTQLAKLLACSGGLEE
jgi:hypothetical protein